ncbi:MAG: hypothetical protein HY344_04375 [Candidatus Levybacteria bacterium]|nr:hypothetical protein [Candidatus Levybacteria bacterium]
MESKLGIIGFYISILSFAAIAILFVVLSTKLSNIENNFNEFNQIISKNQSIYKSKFSNIERKQADFEGWYSSFNQEVKSKLQARQ